MDVFLEKTADVAELVPTAAMEVGNVLEGAIIDWSLKALGKPAAKRNQRRVHENDVMAANLDCLIDGGHEAIPLEVKFSNQPNEWGPENGGFDSIPIQYGCQVLHQMACVGAKRAYLGAFIAGFRAEFRLFEISGVDDMIAGIVDQETRWWRMHVEGRTPPIDCAPASLETLGRMFREGGKSVPIAPELVQQWRAMYEAKKKAEEAEEAAKAEVLQALGDAEEGECSLGIVTYRQQTQRRLDGERLKSERPDIAEAYTKASTFRVCRFSAVKPAKGGKAKVGA